MRREFDLDFVLTDTVTATRVTVVGPSTFLVRLMKAGVTHGKVVTFDTDKSRFVGDLTGWLDQDKDISVEDLKALASELRSNGQARPETGPMQFGDDWPGIYMRGDNAGYYAFTLQTVLNKLANDSKLPGPIELAILKNLAAELEGAIVEHGLKTARDCQIMHPWEHCFWGKTPKTGNKV